MCRISTVRCKYGRETLIALGNGNHEIDGEGGWMVVFRVVRSESWMHVIWSPQLSWKAGLRTLVPT